MNYDQRIIDKANKLRRQRKSWAYIVDHCGFTSKWVAYYHCVPGRKDRHRKATEKWQRKNKAKYSAYRKEYMKKYNRRA